jgi:DNA-binding transcriptional MerR regulator
VTEHSYLSIGQVLDTLKQEFPDLTISKIRFLESQGLLDPERTPSGYRKFYEPDVDRLRFILRAQHEQYLPLKVIKGRLGMEVDDDEDEGEGDHPDGLAMAATPEPTAPARLELVTPPEPAPTAPPRPVATPVPEPVPAVAEIEIDVTEPVSLTLDELAGASGLSPADLAELERFGLMAGRKVAGTVYYDADCLELATLAARFRAYGVEARHLRMYRTAVEREAGFFEQVVTPMLKQRNPQARRQAVDTLLELSRLGHAFRAAALRQALRDYLS